MQVPVHLPEPRKSQKGTRADSKLPVSKPSSSDGSILLPVTKPSHSDASTLLPVTKSSLILTLDTRFTVEVSTRTAFHPLCSLCIRPSRPSVVWVHSSVVVPWQVSGSISGSISMPALCSCSGCFFSSVITVSPSFRDPALRAQGLF